MFDPALAGYWGSADLDAATDTLLELITAHAGKVDGIKVSLLDADREVALRRRLPAGVRLYTGDDFNYPELIRGDEQGHSDALLGIFAAIAPAAAAALARARRRRRRRRYDAILDPDRAAGPAPLRRAHLLLQDRHRVPGLAGRAPGPLHHGRRRCSPAGRRPHLADAAPAWPTRPGCCPTPTWPPRGRRAYFTVDGRDRSEQLSHGWRRLLA